MGWSQYTFMILYCYIGNHFIFLNYCIGSLYSCSLGYIATVGFADLQIGIATIQFYHIIYQMKTASFVENCVCILEGLDKFIQSWTRNRNKSAITFAKQCAVIYIEDVCVRKCLCSCINHITLCFSIIKGQTIKLCGGGGKLRTHSHPLLHPVPL